MAAKSTIPWPEIYAKYAVGCSQRALSREFGIAQASISQRAKKEGWQRLVTIPDVIPPASTIASDNDEATSPALAQKLLQQIASHLRSAQDEPLTPNAIKLLADSLSIVFKIEQVSHLNEQPTESRLPSELLAFLTDAQLGEISRAQMEIEKILDQARARKLQDETGIPTLHTARR